MKLTNQETTKTRAKYIIKASEQDLNKYRDYIASNLKSTVKVPGFRPGKAPTDMILKYADQDVLQNEFLNHAVNQLYMESQGQLGLRIVGEPKISVTKFVPFTTLEVSVEVPIIKDLKLPNYKNFKIKKTLQPVTKDLIDHNLSELQRRAATTKVVKRPAKKGDLVVIDFEATDPKTKQKLLPASAENYRLVIGGDSLIPGFEDNLIGLAATKSKSFDLTFPKDYTDKNFAARKVHFKVTVKEVNELNLGKLDDDFASKVGPFKNLSELKAEISRQLEAESKRQATIDYENQILQKLAEETIVELDDELIDSEAEFLVSNAKQSALNRGQTWEEFLVSLGQSEDAYLKDIRKAATSRIRGGLAIGEISIKEGINISEVEVDNEILRLKAQYSDPAMQQELDNPNNRRELRLRLMTEKTLDSIQKDQPKTS